jgi:hypothetical protein
MVVIKRKNKVILNKNISDWNEVNWDRIKYSVLKIEFEFKEGIEFQLVNNLNEIDIDSICSLTLVLS